MGIWFYIIACVWSAFILAIFGLLLIDDFIKGGNLFSDDGVFERFNRKQQICKK